MKYLKVFVDFEEDLDQLSDAECGRLFRAMLKYASSGTVPELYGNERFLWPGAKKNIDRQDDSYQSKVAAAEKARQQRNATATDIRAKQNKNSDIRNKTLISTQDKDKDKDIKETLPNGSAKKSAQRFDPPTVEQVREYCEERGNYVDPDRFVDFYSAKGWMVGKNHMKDWKAAVRTWERDSHPAPQSTSADDAAIREWEERHQ